MIKNDQQLAVTRAQRDKLMGAIDALKNGADTTPITAVRNRALKADVKKLKEQIAKYREASKGVFDIVQIACVEHVGEELVTARIASGLTQEELARRIGKKPQQIQRYERSLYMTASLKTLTDIATIFASMHERGHKGKNYA